VEQQQPVVAWPCPCLLSYPGHIAGSSFVMRFHRRRPDHTAHSFFCDALRFHCQHVTAKILPTFVSETCHRHLTRMVLRLDSSDIFLVRSLESIIGPCGSESLLYETEQKYEHDRTAAAIYKDKIL
jgi:hypothetical protein